LCSRAQLLVEPLASSPSRLARPVALLVVSFCPRVQPLVARQAPSVWLWALALASEEASCSVLVPRHRLLLVALCRS